MNLIKLNWNALACRVTFDFVDNSAWSPLDPQWISAAVILNPFAVVQQQYDKHNFTWSEFMGHRTGRQAARWAWGSGWPLKWKVSAFIAPSIYNTVIAFVILLFAVCSCCRSCLHFWLNYLPQCLINNLVPSSKCQPSLPLSPQDILPNVLVFVSGRLFSASSFYFKSENLFT